MNRFALSLALCTLTVLVLLPVDSDLEHWFVIPVILCGAVVGADALAWFTRLDPFDPVGIIGLLGVHFFFAAPLLHVVRDYWIQETTTPADWRPWLGGMACLNLLGLLLYRVMRSLPALLPVRAAAPDRALSRSRFLLLAGLALLISAGLQAWVYRQYGGLVSYIKTALDYTNQDRMKGMGMIFMISESFPIVALMVFAVLARGRKGGVSWGLLVAVLLAFFCLKMLFGGLRGSRSNTIWGLFWAVGIIHLWLRPVSKVPLVAGCGVLVVFMYFYGLYKSAGLDAVDSFGESPAQGELAEKTHRTVDTLLLGDLGRTDIQALLLWRLSEPDPDYDYAWGRTYLGALLLVIPKSIWPDRPPEKVKEGTEVQFGRGTFVLPDWMSSRVYGLAGEAMLNFGPAAVPFAFALFGLLVGWLRVFLARLTPGDPRRLLAPFWVIFALSWLASDSDNMLFLTIKDGLVPGLLLWLSVRRLGQPVATPARRARPCFLQPSGVAC